MIVDESLNQTKPMGAQSQNQNPNEMQEFPPPSYDLAVNEAADGGSNSAYPTSSSFRPRKDSKQTPLPQPHPQMPLTTVYHYVHPHTGERIDSLLPPEHPEMVCLQQGHVPQTKYGLLGVLAAVLWFPLGIGLCLLDRRVRCQRCGYAIDDGVCG